MSATSFTTKRSLSTASDLRISEKIKSAKDVRRGRSLTVSAAPASTAKVGQREGSGFADAWTFAVLKSTSNSRSLRSRSPTPVTFSKLGSGSELPRAAERCRIPSLFRLLEAVHTRLLFPEFTLREKGEIQGLSRLQAAKSPKIRGGKRLTLGSLPNGPDIAKPGYSAAGTFGERKPCHSF